MLAVYKVLNPARHLWRELLPGAKRLNRTGADNVRCKGGRYTHVHRTGAE
uniref:Uncharacterized protein n=1 Tax=Citrobacter freundii TaxID=546 RepID=A0A3T0VED2_CITFR|nr:hypothetical protein [Citrobacter freundii]